MPPQPWPWPNLFGKDSLDLFQVIEVVPGGEFRDSRNRLLATLGVNTVVVPLCRRKRLQQIQVRFAKSGETFERLARIRFALTHCLRPPILVECLNWGAGSAEDRAKAIADHQLDIREMSQNF